MKKQHGSTLVVSLVLLTIVTLVAVYALEGTNLQSKMVANSLFGSLTYQECRNEQEANVHFYNDQQEDGTSNRGILLNSMTGDQNNRDATLTTPITTNAHSDTPGWSPKSTFIINWQFMRTAPLSRGGHNIDSEGQSKAYLFNHTCTATLSFASNSQTLGAVVEGLRQAGNFN